MGGFFRNYPSPPDWNSEGVKWCKSWAAKGVKWCKSEGVICPEGVKWCESWAAKGGKADVRVRG